MFSRKNKMLLFTIIAVMIFTLALPSTVFAQPFATFPEGPPTVRVTGGGSIVVEPDIAMITLGVSTNNSNPRTAIRENSARMNEVLAALRALDIDDDDIVTNQFSLHQTFNPAWDSWRIVENDGENIYTAHNTVNVSIRDLSLIGDVIGVSVDAGANMSGNVWFSVEDTGALYYEALALAIQDANAKAQTIARALGSSITGIVSVSEASWSAPISRGTGLSMEASAMMFRASDWGAPIQSGMVEVTARVEIVYTLAQ